MEQSQHREQATQAADLPHAYIRRSEAIRRCSVCDGGMSDPLHEEFARQRAAEFNASQPMARETGS